MEVLSRDLEIPWVPTLATAFLAYVIGKAYYNLFLHPLAAFPGPLFARVSLLWRVWSTMSGRHPQRLSELHKKHGHIVRVAPNELSFSGMKSYEDIYGIPRGGRQHFTKSDFYDIYGSAYKTGCIGSERDPIVHIQMKKNIVGAFTPKALSQQESIMQQNTDLFIEKIGIKGENNAAGVDITKWLEMLTFDIFGDMAFGESFGCLTEEKHHFWLRLILDHIYEITLIDNLRRFWLLATLAKLLIPSSLIMKVREKHSGYSRKKVKERFEKDTDRFDFLTNIVDKVKSGEMSMEEMTAHSSTLIIAGAETTATELAAAIFFILKSPEVRDKLVDEIRSRYATYDEIDTTSAQQLPYLRAVINETLRVYPAGAMGFPRYSPGATVDGTWIPKGTEVSTSSWVVSHNPEYFSNPDVFNPERWIDPGCTDLKNASQPFSLGHRSCIGKAFAYAQMSSCLAKILFSYDLELMDKNLDFEGLSLTYIMWWKPHVYVSIKRRS